MLVPVMFSIVILMLLIIIVKLEKKEVTKSATVDKLEPRKESDGLIHELIKPYRLHSDQKQESSSSTTATVDKLEPTIEYGENTQERLKLEDKFIVSEVHKKILERVSTGSEVVTASFRVSTNDMVLRKGAYSVILEYSEEDKPICYTVIKGETTKDVIYMDQVDKWLINKAQAKPEEKQKTNSTQKSVKYYKDKVKQYIQIKETTMRNDKSILSEIGLTKMALNAYGKEYEAKIKELREECKKRHIEKVKKARL